MSNTKPDIKEEKTVEEILREKAVEKVEVFVPIDPNDKTPLYVSVNGKNMLIKRGSRVTVPRNVAEILRNSDEQALIVNDLEEAGAEKASNV